VHFAYFASLVDRYLSEMVISITADKTKIIYSLFMQHDRSTNQKEDTGPILQLSLGTKNEIAVISYMLLGLRNPIELK
jgi:hypothetical protein